MFLRLIHRTSVAFISTQNLHRLLSPAIMTRVTLICILNCLTLTLTATARRTRQSRCLAQAPLICNFTPTKGNMVSGRAIFTPIWKNNRCCVRIRSSITGLNRNVKHGWHIHVCGDLSSTDGSTFGGHFTSPKLDNRPHGLPDDRKRHWEDLGNLVNNNQAYFHYDEIDKAITLLSIVGRGMIVHADHKWATNR